MPQQKYHDVTPKSARRGVTLIEIALVLVIVGILLGGVLKGQEIINNSRIRALGDQQNSIRVAWHSFVAKFGAKPGDYIFAQQNIPGAGPALNGSPVSGKTGDGIIIIIESPIVFQNMSGAGFLKCNHCNEQRDATPSARNSPRNSYGGIMAVYNNGAFAPVIALPSYASHAPGSDRENPLMIHSGPNIPSNIAAELDRKIDDGIANSGEVVFNSFTAGGVQGTPSKESCMSTSAINQVGPTELHSSDPLFWRNASIPPDPNCGFSLYL